MGLVYGLLSAVEALVDYCNNTKRNGVTLSKDPIIRNRIADLLTVVDLERFCEARQRLSRTVSPQMRAPRLEVPRPPAAG